MATSVMWREGREVAKFITTFVFELFPHLFRFGNPGASKTGDAKEIVVLRCRCARVVGRGVSVGALAAGSEERRGFLAGAGACFFVRDEGAFGVGVAIVVDESHAGGQGVLGDGRSSCRVAVEAPGEGENAEKENEGAEGDLEICP